MIKGEREKARSKAMRGKSKVHEITIKVRFDADLTPSEARFAVWNHIGSMTLYGDGKPDAYDRAMGIRSNEPYGEGRIIVRRR